MLIWYEIHFMLVSKEFWYFYLARLSLFKFILTQLNLAQPGLTRLSTAIGSILALKSKRSPFCSNTFEFFLSLLQKGLDINYHFFMCWSPKQDAIYIPWKIYLCYKFQVNICLIFLLLFMFILYILVEWVVLYILYLYHLVHIAYLYRYFSDIIPGQ